MNETPTLPSPLASAARLSLGALRFWLTGRTPDYAYQSMISLFCHSAGASNDAISSMISLLHPPYRLESTSGVLGDLGADTLERITRDLDERGYHVFERRLPGDLCDRLLHFGLTTRCTVRPMPLGGGLTAPKLVTHYNRKHPEGVRYDFGALDVIDNPNVQRLMADASIIAVAQSYLRCKPIVDVTSMWWHTAFADAPDEQAAQFYHFDMDRIKWLKFFIYLTDVGPGNGPHCFVEGSHRTGAIHARLRAKGYARLTDQEVGACFPHERFIEIIGPRGTVIAEDTRGLHKGKHVTRGDRLMLQLQFSNSLYGGTYEKTRFTRVVDPDLQTRIGRYPRLYSNYAG